MDLEEQAAAAGVTKLKLFIFLALGLFAVVNCAVDLADSTPGALSCEPTPTQIDDFHTTTYKGFIQINCAGGSCHSNGATNKGYMFLNPEPTDLDTERKKENLCFHISFGQTLVDFPTTSPNHPSVGVSLTPISDWLDSI